MLKNPIVYEIAHRTYAVNELGMASFFVVVGSERGLVIDSGCGSFNSRELVEKLCPKPYDVVITHAHGDHCGAMQLWEEVWLHPGDLDIVENHRDRINAQFWENPAIWPMKDGPAGIMMPNGTLWPCIGMDGGSKSVYDFEGLKFMGVTGLPKFKMLENGQIFDLGDRKLTVVHTPGHTPGSCCLIDDKSRILFSADSCNIMMGAVGCSVETTYKGLLRLNELRDTFDQNFNSHVGYGANLTCMSMPDSVLDDCIWCCRTILNGKDGPIRREGVLPNGRKAAMLHHGAVTFRYNPNHIKDE